MGMTSKYHLFFVILPKLDFKKRKRAPNPSEKLPKSTLFNV